MNDVLLMEVIHSETSLEEIDEGLLLWELLTFLDVVKQRTMLSVL
jgi:hypothetical protein